MKQDFQEVHFFSKALDYERCSEVRNYFRTRHDLRGDEQKSKKPKMTDDCSKINCHDCKEIVLRARGC